LHIRFGNFHLHFRKTPPLLDEFEDSLINDMFITHDVNTVILNNVVELKGVLCRMLLFPLKTQKNPTVGASVRNINYLPFRISEGKSIT